VNSYFLQGTAATDFKGGGTFNYSFLRSSIPSLTVKTLRKVVHICQSYLKNKTGLVFETWCIHNDNAIFVYRNY